MNDNTENILINVEKCVPTLIMRQLLSTRAFCAQTHFDTNCALTEPIGMLFLKLNGADTEVTAGSAGIRGAATTATPDRLWDKLKLDVALLIYSELPLVAQIKANIQQVEFQEKSVNENQITLNQTCLHMFCSLSFVIRSTLVDFQHQRFITEF